MWFGAGHTAAWRRPSLIALSFLSSIGALVPIYNPEARFELPLV